MDPALVAIGEVQALIVKTLAEKADLEKHYMVLTKMMKDMAEHMELSVVGSTLPQTPPCTVETSPGAEAKRRKIGGKIIRGEFGEPWPGTTAKRGCLFAISPDWEKMSWEKLNGMLYAMVWDDSDFVSSHLLRLLGVYPCVSADCTGWFRWARIGKAPREMRVEIIYSTKNPNNPEATHYVVRKTKRSDQLLYGVVRVDQIVEQAPPGAGIDERLPTGVQSEEVEEEEQME